MTALTQVSFTADPDLKDKALRKAKNEGISLKSLLVYAMKAFVAGKISLGLVDTESEKDVEEVFFSDPALYKKASEIAHLLK